MQTALQAPNCTEICTYAHKGIDALPGKFENVVVKSFIVIPLILASAAIAHAAEPELDRCKPAERAATSNHPRADALA
jgi:hypothetical protein